MEIKRICVLAELDDGTVREIVLTENQRDKIITLIHLTTDEGQSIKINEKILEGIEFYNEKIFNKGT